MVRLALPFLCLWTLPPLLTRGVFPENEMFLMLASAGLVIATEATLRGAALLDTEPFQALARRLRPRLVALG